MKKIIFLIFILTLTGCSLLDPAQMVLSPLIEAYVYWKDNEGHKFYNHNSAFMHQAALRAAARLNAKITKDLLPKNNLYYFVAGKNNYFKVTIKPTEPNISEVVIRVNFLGNKPFGDLFYQYIDEELDTIEWSKSHVVPH